MYLRPLLRADIRVRRVSNYGDTLNGGLFPSPYGSGRTPPRLLALLMEFRQIVEIVDGMVIGSMSVNGSRAGIGNLPDFFSDGRDDGHERRGIMRCQRRNCISGQARTSRSSRVARLHPPSVARPLTRARTTYLLWRMIRKYRGSGSQDGQD